MDEEIFDWIKRILNLKVSPEGFDCSELTPDDWQTIGSRCHGRDWFRLLILKPEFADRCPWRNYPGDAWGSLLSAQPQFAGNCDLAKLSDEDWDSLLTDQPQFAAKRGRPVGEFREKDAEKAP